MNFNPNKQCKKMKKILPIVLVCLFIFIGSSEQIITDYNKVFSCSEELDEPCAELVENCRATADENLSSGLYNEAQWDLFYNTVCPNAGLDCIFSTYGG